MLRRRLYAAAPRYGVSISLFLLLVIYFICFLRKINTPRFDGRGYCQRLRIVKAGELDTADHRCV